MVSALTKVNANQKLVYNLVAAQQKTFMTQATRPLLSSFSLFQQPACFRAFSTTSKALNQQAGAAETPASHMHRTMSLDSSIQSFYERQTGTELSLDSLTAFMAESMLRGPMSYQSHKDYHPIIDELVFYVNQWYEQQEASKRTATNEQA